VKFVKDAAVYTMFVTHSSRNETYHLTCILDLMITIILIHRPQVASPFGHGRPTIENPPNRLLGGTSVERIFLFGGGEGGEAETQRWWALGSLKKRKGELIY